MKLLKNLLSVTLLLAVVACSEEPNAPVGEDPENPFIGKWNSVIQEGALWTFEIDNSFKTEVLVNNQPIATHNGTIEYLNANQWEFQYTECSLIVGEDVSSQEFQNVPCGENKIFETTVLNNGSQLQLIPVIDGEVSNIVETFNKVEE